MCASIGISERLLSLARTAAAARAPAWPGSVLSARDAVFARDVTAALDPALREDRQSKPLTVPCGLTQLRGTESARRRRSAAHRAASAAPRTALRAAPASCWPPAPPPPPVPRPLPPPAAPGSTPRRRGPSRGSRPERIRRRAPRRRGPRIDPRARTGRGGRAASPAGIGRERVSEE